MPNETTEPAGTLPGHLRAILIDPTTKTVTDITLPRGDGSLQDLVSAATGFTAPWFIAFGMHLDHLYVEERDYLSGEPGFRYGTLPLFGRGLVIGRDTKAGVFTDCTATCRETADWVQFLDDTEHVAARAKRKKMHS